MTTEEWQRVRAVFDDAIKHERGERDAFLDKACDGNPGLRAEVTSLLDAHDRAADFIEAPAFEAAAHLLLDDSSESLEGGVVGPYLIRQEIGRGGMGVVYLADDTRLSRRVALKALAPGAGRKTEQRERLRREARAAASLSHPGIATVYALEEIGDELYLACEYVPGSTLRAQISQGPLPPAQIIDIATQLGSALAAAHAQGVVHRDLKPENIVKTPAGILKVLDFGVARIESLASARLTQEGTSPGTPGYMAPEQVLGEDADFRSDLFSFGVLVYEMASGANPFEAETAAATVARILAFDPAPLSTVCPGLPILDRIVATCLRKDPRERYRSTLELAADLQRLQAEMSADPDRATSSRGREVPVAADAPRILTPRWWWEIHQVVVATIYVLMVYPAWRVRPWLPPPWGMLFLFVVLACAAAATSLRLHLWFTARFYPVELPIQRARALPWARSCDAVLAASLLLAALGIGNDHPEVATLLIAVATAAAVASLMIEPATTRAAFPDQANAVRSPSSERRST